MNQFKLSGLVLAMVSCTAFAQSNVSISGFLAGGYENYRVSGPTAANNGTVNAISNNASRLIFSGEENLGGGLKAFFVVDNRFSIETNASGTMMGNGNAGVGLQGDFGKITIGRWDMHYNEGKGLERQRALADQTYFTEGLLIQFNGNNVARATRSDNVIKYDSPTVGGFNGTVAYSSNPNGQDGAAAANASKNGAYWLAARYANGPLSGGISYWNYNLEGTAANQADQRALRGWLGYRFAMGLSLGLVVDQSKVRNTTTGIFDKRTAWSLPISYAFGEHAVYFNYGSAGNVSRTSDTSARAWLVGYDYALSKRTSLGTNYAKLNNNRLASYDLKGPHQNTANGDDVRQFYVGIKHTF